MRKGKDERAREERVVKEGWREGEKWSYVLLKMGMAELKVSNREMYGFDFL